jgi:hypothetical protein
LAFNIANFGAKLWGVESFFLSVLQSSTLNYGKLATELWNIDKYFPLNIPKFNKLQFMVFMTWFSNKKKVPKNDRCQKNHLINLDKLICSCPMRLGSQIGPYHFN